MGKTKKVLSMLLAVVLLVAAIPFSAGAETSPNVIELDISKGDVKIKVNALNEMHVQGVTAAGVYNETIPIYQTELVITGTTSQYGITIEGIHRNSTTTVFQLQMILGTETKALHIDRSAQDNEAAILLKDGAKVEMRCAGTAGVKLRSGDGCAGIEMRDSSELKISSGKIALAQGGRGGAGIGNGENHEDSYLSYKLTIAGTTIVEKAQGGMHAPGIGGGAQYDSVKITITDSAKIVTAQGGQFGAGIGGGYGYRSPQTIISGNAVVQNAQGGDNAAGIGAGADNRGYYIEILGDAVVTATGGDGIVDNDIAYGGAAGIGDGSSDKTSLYGGTGYRIHTGAKVTAKGGNGAKGDFSDYSTTPQWGYAGGGAAIGGAGGAVRYVSGYEGVVAYDGDSIYSITTLPKDLAGITAIPGTGAKENTYQMGGNGAEIGQGGKAYLGVAATPNPDFFSYKGVEESGYSENIRLERPQLTIDFLNERLVGITPGDYKFGDYAPRRFYENQDFYSLSVTEMTGEVLKIVRIGDGVNFVDSPAQELIIPKRPAAPTGLRVQNVSLSGNGADGKIIGVSSAMKYIGRWYASYIDCTGNEITGLQPGTYSILYKPTATAFSSEPANVEVKTNVQWSTNPFRDVNNSDWFYRDVEYAYLNNLFAGTSDTTFSPHMVMNRGMLVTVLGRMSGESIPTSGYNMTFTDVNRNRYYAPYVAWAAKNGIVSGFDSKTFSPDAPITREQIASILYRYAIYKGEKPIGSGTLKYPDAGSISGWAKDGALYCQTNNIIAGKTGGVFDPRGGAERCEVAAMLHRFAEK